MDVYTKFDLHIHSSSSAKTKSGDKTIVQNSTIENLHVLVEKLIENGVNMVAITDHDIFDKDIYLKLKEQESEDNAIYKVLPGVEIDLNIDEKIVHVVCIFDDTVPGHVDKIVAGFEQRSSYTVDELASMLRSIGLGTILIAHQKCDYTTEKQQKTSLSYCGKDQFYKFIGCEFFDALEIQNAKVEGILKSRFSADNISNINLVVGSDCHEWDAYPAHHLGRVPIELMYIKALPTFEGLIMAVTDNSRIYKYIEPPKENTLKELSLNVNGTELRIPLSDKINAIIGDNSVGKSTIVKYLSGVAEKEAIDFLKVHKVDILTEPLKNEYFTFSGQGKIREMFESTKEKLSIKERFKDQFRFINKAKYENEIKRILDYYKKVWERNDLIKSNLQSLNRNIYVPVFTESDKHYLSIESNISKQKNSYKGLTDIFEDLFIKFKDFNEFKDVLTADDIQKLLDIRSNIVQIGKKYYCSNQKIETDLEVQSIFEYVSQKYVEAINKLSSSDEIMLNTYRNEYHRAIDNICMDLEYKFTPLDNAWDNFKEFKIPESVSQKGKYCFIDKVIKGDLINKALIENYISSFLSIEKPLETLTATEVLSSIRTKRNAVETAENIDQLLSIIYANFIEEYMTTTVEIKQGNDKLNESNSAGINALYYIDILSETYCKPIFIIDQPEDDVSQSRISTHLIQSLKTLSHKAQIIIVTHNPQLVVNLDVDNVIVIKKDDNDINFLFGPLEFSSKDYSILTLVANTLDGGAEVIKRRWKRYAKTGI